MVAPAKGGMSEVCACCTGCTYGLVCIKSSHGVCTTGVELRVLWYHCVYSRRSRSFANGRGFEGLWMNRRGLLKPEQGHPSSLLADK